MSSASIEITPSTSLSAAQESFRNGTSSDDLQEFKDNDGRRKNRVLKDPRDATAVAAGLCTEHGCKAAPMVGYRKCQKHHEQKRQRDSSRYLAKPHGLKRAAYREAVIQGRCVKPGCLLAAVKFKKCVAHMTTHQQNSIGPKVRKKKKEIWSSTPEYSTITTHLQSIKTAYKAKNATYAKMPFFASWDPQQGGRPIAGAQWIVENLGHKPSKDHELHIIDRHLGFVPENLAWVPREDHKREELLTKLLIENQQLKTRIAELEGKS